MCAKCGIERVTFRLGMPTRGIVILLLHANEVVSTLKDDAIRRDA